MQNGSKENYQRVMEAQLKEEEKRGRIGTLLLHSCCAPCSSYVLEYLSNFFEITVFYYNPNISPIEEYEARAAEQKRLISELPTKLPVKFLEGRYEPERFYHTVSGYETCREGGDRCTLCFELRLTEAAKAAKEGGFDYFTTTLSISPLKDAERLNKIGKRISEEFGVSYLFSDFKKKGGYQRSIALSSSYRLYRQNYCGCVFSKEEQRKKAEGN